MTKQEAVDLSILKWEYIVKNDGKLEGVTIAHPELADLRAHCGLCQYQHMKHRSVLTMCDDCPLSIVDKYSCHYKESAYYRWYDSRKKVDAEIVLNLLKLIKI